MISYDRKTRGQVARHKIPPLPALIKSYLIFELKISGLVIETDGPCHFFSSV